MVDPPDSQRGISSLSAVLPPRRVAALLRAAGGCDARALALHRWNEEIGGALYAPLQRAELGLRARVSRAFADVYGPLWFAQPGFRQASSHGDRKEVAEASRRLMAADEPVDAAGLLERASFGLWVGLLRPAHNPAVWSTQLRAAFPALPPKQGRWDVASHAAGAAWLRNRIGHHELLVGLDLSTMNTRLLTLLDWLDPALGDEARAADRVQALLRARP